MVVEFCGLPGVGKSTIARALHEYGFERVRIQSKLELILSNIGYLGTEPVAFFKVFFYITKTALKHGRFYRLFMNVFLDTNARIFKARRMSSHAIVDQGHLQAFVSLAYHALGEHEVVRFLKSLPKPDAVVALIAPDEVRKSHLSERGYGPRKDESGMDVWFLHMEQNMETVIQSVKKTATYPVHVVRTDSPVVDVVKTVLAALKV